MFRAELEGGSERKEDRADSEKMVGGTKRGNYRKKSDK